MAGKSFCYEPVLHIQPKDPCPAIIFQTNGSLSICHTKLICHWGFRCFKCFARLRFKQSKKHTRDKTLCHLMPSAATLVKSVSSCSSQNDHAISHGLCWHQKLLSDVGLGFLCLKLSSIYSVIAVLRILTRHLGPWCDVHLAGVSCWEALFKDEAGSKWSLQCFTQLGKVVMFFKSLK